ncbi:MAG: multicopper oxidase family protein [Anaerolineae bacterium]|nr:multicopper oxidase family protein [Anaerolineae bacterium]
MQERKPTRREFLTWIGITGVAGLLSACGLSAAGTGQTHVGAVDSSQRAQKASDPEDLVELALVATKDELQILPGGETPVLRYKGRVLRGDPDVLQELPGSYLGPVIRLRRGQRVRVHLANELDEETIVHWHGLHMPPEADGHPHLAIGPGETYTYDFPVIDRAGTYWYHPHPHGRTGPQVYRGLAGLLIVSDEEEERLGLPDGARDIPLVIQDRSFDRANRLSYIGGGRMDQMLGFLGDRILVNGQPDYRLSLAAGAYRLRLLNGSNSRVYKLAWDDGSPLTVIATDGGLLEKPLQRDYVTLAPGERVELRADFGADTGDGDKRLVSLPFAGEVMGGMMGAGLGSSVTLPQGAPLSVLSVEVHGSAAPSASLPAQLSRHESLELGQAVNRDRPRRIELEMQGMRWLINGRSFHMTDVAEDEIVRLGDVEVWEMSNQPGPMRMIHPMHIHNVQFKVIERQIAAAFRPGWETVSAGYVDEGWKDTVLLMPGETARVLMRFDHYAGLYLYHCHNLEHEDLGMMRNFLIEA